MSFWEQVWNLIKRCIVIFFIFISICCVIIISYHLDVIFLEFYPHYISNAEKTDYIESFAAYRDFVVVITGLLTCIIGFAAVGGYISFKNIKDEEKKIRRIRKTYDMLIGIQSMNMINYEDDTELRVNFFKKYKFSDLKDSSLWTIMADSFFEEGSEKSFKQAKEFYKRALDIDKSNPQAYFGLARAIFKIDFFKELKKSNDEKFSREVDGNLYHYDLEITEFENVRNLHIKKENFSNFSESNINFKEILQHFNKAKSYGYNENLVAFEVAQMYFQCANYEKALNEYKKALKNNSENLKTSFYYVKSWITFHNKDLNKFMNDPEEENNISSDDIDKIIKILEKVVIGFHEQSMSSYAFLWYLYKVQNNPSKCNLALNATSAFTINNIFVTKNPTDE